MPAQLSPERGVERLASDQHPAQRRRLALKPRRQQHPQLRRGAVEHLQTTLVDEAQQRFRVHARLVGDEAQRGAARQARPLFDRGVEGEGSVQAHAQRLLRLRLLLSCPSERVIDGVVERAQEVGD